MSNRVYNLKRVRELKGVSPTELGKWCGFDEKTSYVRIADYEKFKRNPNDVQMTDFATILDVIPEVLLSAPKHLTRELIAWRLLEMSEKLWLEIHDDCIVFKDPEYKAFLKEWKEKDDEYNQGKITQDEYYKWKIERRL